MSETSAAEYFVCGGFGGICTVLVGHPLDTVKVRLQTASTSTTTKNGHTPHYTGTLDCIRKIMVHEGFRGFYKGMAAPLAGVAPIFAISFMTYGIGKQSTIWSDSNHPYLQYFMAGAFSGIFTTLLTAPGERIKCLLQIQEGKSNKTYDGPVDVVRKLYKQGGIMSIFRGSGATLLRDVPASGCYFLTYEALKNYITDHGRREISVMGTLFAGGCAGVANWLVGIPPDVLKSRLQSAPEGRYPKGIRDVFRELVKNEGVLALYKGVTPVLLRAFPANAACFVGFELCKKFIHFVKSKIKGDSSEDT